MTDIRCDDILVFSIGGNTSRCRVSKIDGNVVKLFEEDRSYRQVPYSNLKKMIEEGYVTVERPQTGGKR